MNLCKTIQKTFTGFLLSALLYSPVFAKPTIWRSYNVCEKNLEEALSDHKNIRGNRCIGVGICESDEKDIAKKLTIAEINAMKNYAEKCSKEKWPNGIFFQNYLLKNGRTASIAELCDFLPNENERRRTILRNGEYILPVKVLELIEDAYGTSFAGVYLREVKEKERGKLIKKMIKNGVSPEDAEELIKKFIQSGNILIGEDANFKEVLLHERTHKEFYAMTENERKSASKETKAYLKDMQKNQKEKRKQFSLFSLENKLHFDHCGDDVSEIFSYLISNELTGRRFLENSDVELIKSKYPNMYKMYEKLKNKVRLNQ